MVRVIDFDGIYYTVKEADGRFKTYNADAIQNAELLQEEEEPEKPEEPEEPEKPEEPEEPEAPKVEEKLAEMSATLTSGKIGVRIVNTEEIAIDYDRLADAVRARSE